MNFEELMQAYLECRKNKRYSIAALAFELDCERELLRLYREVMDGSYTINPSISFIVTEPVKREVFAADFRDRIIHHWLIGKLNPLFEKEFIYDSYGCRKDKGTLFGVKRIKRFIAQCSQNYTKDCYILRCDIKGFFMNIDRVLLVQILDNFIIDKYGGEDKELVRKLTRIVAENDPIIHCQFNSPPRLWDNIPADKSIFTNNGLPMPNGFLPKVKEHNSPKGIPIGNLTSQVFANFYLNALDHYVKHHLGERYYGRYIDDFIIVHSSMEHLKELIGKCREFLMEQRKLQLHPNKIYLQHYSKGVAFLGVNIKKGVLHTGRRTVQGAYKVLHTYNSIARKRKLTEKEMIAFRQSLNSYLGIMTHHRSYKKRKRIIRNISGWIANRISYPGYNKITIN